MAVISLDEPAVLRTLPAGAAPDGIVVLEDIRMSLRAERQ